MLDIHILLTDRLPEEWKEQAMASLRMAIAAATIPIFVYTLPENTEDFWKARWDGYSVGTSPWVTYLDLDDWVEEEVFNSVAPLLTGEWDAVQTIGRDYHAVGKKFYPSNRGMRFHKRSTVEAANKLCTHRCCPSCHLYHSVDNKIVLQERLLNMRVGYKSLAGEWRRTNGMG